MQKFGFKELTPRLSAYLYDMRQPGEISTVIVATVRSDSVTNDEGAQ
jgi:hypothetical protein